MKKDPEIAALEAVHTALKPLDPEGRRKVLVSVQALLEIPGFDLQGGQKAPPGLLPSIATGPEPRVPASRPLSVVELMQQKRPSTNVQKIALFAYYRERHEGRSRFARTDLVPYFGVAHEKPPSNYDRDFVEAVKKGWIHEDGADSYITSKGIESVEAGFPGERKYEKSHGPKAGSKAKSTKGGKKEK